MFLYIRHGSVEQNGVGTLANISGKEAFKAFQRNGWVRGVQVGSHLTMTKHGYRAKLSIPQHKDLSVGTLRALIRLCVFLDAICDAVAFADIDDGSSGFIAHEEIDSRLRGFASSQCLLDSGPWRGEYVTSPVWNFSCQQSRWGAVDQEKPDGLTARHLASIVASSCDSV